MTSAALELQKALFGALTGDPELASVMDGVRLYDRAPANATFPYLSFGRTSVYDWSTDTEGGSEHLVTLHAWSKERGQSQCHAMLQAIRRCLDESSLTLQSHVLVRLTWGYSEIRYEDRNDLHHGLIRFRAVTEPVA